MSERGRPIVTAEDVGRTYRSTGAPVHALRSVTLAVAGGDFLAITGPSGSGKSTLLHLLGGVDVPTSGRVTFLGRDLGAMPVEERARLRLLEVGLVFQRFHLLPMLTAFENVELPLAAAGVGRDERRERANEVLMRVGLGDR
ncbi:MAG: ATP-binding cassette domain-containing protein, partial [Gemmatimonadota bacterium]|nr:ATP-binding cassette domain-containing protein [Gemmatimonadota bacterium]